MAISQKSVTVKGTEYLLTHIPAIRGTRILKQIIKLVGPAFAQFQNEKNLGGAMTLLFDNLDAVGVEQLIQELVSSASKGSVGINFDNEFAGEYDKMFLLVKEIAEFNFGSVFTLLGSDGQ
jgi:peptide subunit release factor RF-3